MPIPTYHYYKTERGFLAPKSKVSVTTAAGRNFSGIFLNFHMVVGKGYGSGTTFLKFWFRLYFFYRYDLKFGKIPKNWKIQKSRVLRILVMKLSVHWSWCHLFVMYSLKPVFWYQNYDFLALHLNFMRQNRPKMEPKMTPEPFIYDFSYQIANILAPLCL